MGNTLTIIAKNYKLAKEDLELATSLWEPHHTRFTPLKYTLKYRAANELYKREWAEFKRTELTYGKKLWTLHLARYLLRDKRFLQIEIDKLVEYVTALGSIKLKLAKKAAHRFVEARNSTNEETEEKLKQLLTAMRIRVHRGSKVVHLSPAVDEVLYNQVVGAGFKLYGKEPAWVPKLFDFRSEEVQAERQRQMNEDRSGIWNVNYGKNAALAAQLNRWLFKKDLPRTKDDTEWKIVNPHSKPLMIATPPISSKDDPYSSIWSITGALKARRFDMVFYILYLLPELMILPVFKKRTFLSCLISGNFKVGIPKPWEERMVLEELDKLGCDFKAVDADGASILEVATRHETIDYLKGHGCNLCEAGLGLLSLVRNSMDEFRHEIICKLIEMGVNVLEEHPEEGWYWMPWVIAGKAGISHESLGYMEFQMMIRQRMRKNSKGEYFNNPICQEILARPIEQCAENDSLDLLESVKAGNIPRVKVLIALGAPLDRQGQDGKSCLVHCAESGNIEAARLLLKNFANPRAVNSNNENCFRIAALNSHFDVAKLVRKFGADINEIGPDGSTVAHIAYKQNLEAVLEFCLEQGCNVNIPDSDGLTVQFRAFRDGKDSLAELMQDKYNGDINALDPNGDDLAILAFREKNTEGLKYYAQRGVNIERKNDSGRTLFMEAVLQNDVEMCVALWESGADINTEDNNGCTPLVHAIQTNDMKLCQFLLDKGCNINMKLGKSSLTPLMLALDKQNIEMASVFLDHQADINERDVDGCTALIRCVSAQHFQRNIFDFLLARGCAVNSVDKAGRCALSILIQKGRDEEAHILLDRNGTLICYPDSPWEPIVIALARNDHGNWFHELIKHGANAMNEKVSVLNEYLDKDYFSFDVLKKLAPYNLAIGCPLQIAMERNMNDVVLHLVNSVSDEMLNKATYTKDSQDRTPLLQAMYFSPDFVSVFCKKKYNCRGRDSDGFCPICLAAKMEDMSLTNELYRIVGPKGASVRDGHGRSALTYAANNGWESICDDWFIDEISLDCNNDRNGIIDGYRELLSRQKKAITEVKNMLAKADRELNDMKRELDNQKQKEKKKRDAAKAWGSKQPANNRRASADKIAKRIAQIENARGPCEGVVNELNRRLDTIQSLSREDLLRGFNYRDLLSNALFRDIPRWK